MKFSGQAAQKSGAALRPFTWESPTLAPTECTVKIVACGVCHSDVHVIDNDWGNTTYPVVPGHEIVGVVEAVGDAVAHLEPGDRVGVGWTRGACLTCSDCLRGDEQMCAESKATILDGHGGFADRIALDARFAFKLPDAIDDLHAGPLLCGGITVYSGLREAGMTSGGHVGIIGIGGLGHMAIQFAARMGNHVTAFTTSDDKAELAMQLGASDAVVSREKRAPRAPRKFDVLLSTAPAALDWSSWTGLLATDGTLNFVGIPPEPLTLDVFRLLGRRRRVMASPTGGRAATQEMLRVAAEHGVQPMIETWPIAEVNAAIQSVRDNSVRFRAVVVMD